MTQKEIMSLAANEDAMSALEQIAQIQSNMCHKTIYEQASAKRNMKELCIEIMECINK